MLPPHSSMLRSGGGDVGAEINFVDKLTISPDYPLDTIHL